MDAALLEGLASVGNLDSAGSYPLAALREPIEALLAPLFGFDPDPLDSASFSPFFDAREILIEHSQRCISWYDGGVKDKANMGRSPNESLEIAQLSFRRRSVVKGHLGAAPKDVLGISEYVAYLTWHRRSG